jgi:SM-20-related protein
MLGGNGQITNTSLDKDALKLELANHGFVLIRDFLKTQVADEIFRCLNEDVRWELAYKDGNVDTTKTVEQLRTMSNGERQQLHGRVIEQARNQYQFSYFRYPMIDAYLNEWEPRLMLNDVLESFNSQTCLDLLREITGDPQLRKVEFQATYYAPGHFLKQHNDNTKSAFVMRPRLA